MVQFSKWIDVPIIRIGHNGVNSHYQRYYMNKKDIMDGQPPTLHLPGLMTFEAAARHLNFARAAAEIGVTPTAVSRTIKNLEAQLTVRLFNRTTRSVSLTEAGASLNKSLAPALTLIRNSLSHALLATDQPSGTLRLSVSYVAYRILIEPHLPSFLERYPLITVEVSLDNQLSDIVNAGFDVGIRMGRKLQNDMISVQLGAVQKGSWWQRLVTSATALNPPPSPNYSNTIASVSVIGRGDCMTGGL
jgi:DNA-binding transcriptional LysR family regulator